MNIRAKTMASLILCKMINHSFATAAFILSVTALLSPQIAAADTIYRGLLIDNQGALDLRAQRFPFNPTLSFNKDLQQIFNAPSNFRCALRMETAQPIPNVGNSSLLRGFAVFQATFDENPPAVPVGHVSVTPAPNIVMQDPSAEFANGLRADALQNPQAFNDLHIVGVPGRESTDDCQDRPKSFN
ncbi:hypothetical protein SAMN05880590_105132 [Rhizobium sp. RU35A]|uniref:hypothetical protein n=1 Tax=Rhizobium sp. RU35A TaxID=1907414 RepID=UPI000953FA8D|nr:hypothetical protein [Rhizobium sp. RU35A]SIQ55559.1 hypothetical protein SAMN05880590_105132 [Rhizobium sp. RU35A]